MTTATSAPVPMLDFSRQFSAIREEVMAAVEEVCVSQKFILGPAVSSFEHAAAQACNAPFGVGCASGTDALWLAMAAAGVGPGDFVVTTPFSFFATASAILRCGATPVFADIDPATFNLSPVAVRDAIRFIQGNLPGTRVAAILPVHLYGQCADWDSFSTIKEEFSLRLIEDAAQAFGANWNGSPAGSLGDAAAFSFYPTKNLSAFGDAGLVTTVDAAIADRSQLLRAHGMRQRYIHEEVGWNSRLDSIQAVVLEVKLRYLPAWNAARRTCAAIYDSLFTAAGLAAADTQNGIVLPITDPRAGHVFHQYVIRAPRRDALRQHLTDRQIGTEIYYPIPLHLQTSLASLGYKPGDFPVTETAAAEVLALPIYPELREDEQRTVVDAIASFYA
ncbi:dTDP-4-amino-4,6-dideoxygalactose transaminase [Granulicella aggregans]|uniref:dTDP-4-amino-4,6-dideoxygalactose transaminase n=1 Tax=Granulicella aggregans TaxID=474949 RepID=A0A7W8E1S9_9BACT|nr:dTDP-4-amino-4,6-dideoxygalactose transaminase [Granulicella aggregans]